MSDLPCDCQGFRLAYELGSITIKNKMVAYFNETFHQVVELSIKCPFCGERLWREKKHDTQT